MRTACGQQNKQETTMDFVDDVKVALADSGHMYAGGDEIRFGIYACSPEESSFTAVFSDMKITECA